MKLSLFDDPVVADFAFAISTKNVLNDPDDFSDMELGLETLDPAILEIHRLRKQQSLQPTG